MVWRLVTGLLSMSLSVGGALAQQAGSVSGHPVEITAEFDTWRKIRDSEGSEGWVLHSLLSGRRTALVAPWKKDVVLPLRRSGAPDAPVVANLQSNVLANVKRCDGAWCRVYGDSFDGYVEETNLWGVYPGEHVD